MFRLYCSSPRLPHLLPTDIYVFFSSFHFANLIIEKLCVLSYSVAFLPYLEESYKDLCGLMDYPSARVKKGAITALGQLCVCVDEVMKSGTEIASSQVGKYDVSCSQLLIIPIWE